MIRQPVQSSNLWSVGYDKSTNVLEIEFHSGGVYQYLGVLEPVYLDLLGAASKGTYFREHIKGHYRYRRVQ